MIYLENENLDDLIDGEKVIVDFYADWCGPCKMLGSVLEQIASEDSSIKIIKVNVDKHEDLARKYMIMSIPRVFVYKNKELVKDITGFTNKDELLKSFE